MYFNKYFILAPSFFWPTNVFIDFLGEAAIFLMTTEVSA